MDPEAMICAIFGFVVVALGIFLFLLTANLLSRSSRLNNGFRVASSTLRGQFSPGGLWRRPCVSIRYANTAGRLRVEKSSGIECTEFSLNWPSMAVKFEIISKRQPFKYRRSEWSEASFGNDRLDRNLQMRSSDPVALQKLMSEGVNWQLDKLQSFMPERDLYCGCVRRQLVVRKWGVIKDARELVQLVRLALELYDQLQLTQVEGIDFVDGVEATLLDEVDCPICGEGIERNLVTCTSCKTPHHKDCWDYNGRCATFACGQEVYARPAVARPIDSGASSPDEEQPASPSKTQEPAPSTDGTS